MAYSSSSVQRDWQLEHRIKEISLKENTQTSIVDLAYTFQNEPVSSKTQVYGTESSVPTYLYDVSKKSTGAAISQGLNFLLQTKKYERPFNPGFFCDIHHFLFEPINVMTAEAIKEEIADAVIANTGGFFELLGVVVDPDEEGLGYHVYIKGTVIDEPEEIVIESFLRAE